MLEYRSVNSEATSAYGNGKRVMRSPLEALSDSPRYSRNPEKVSSDKNFSPALFERTIAAQFEKALAKEFSDEDSALDNEFVISNPKSGTMELQQDLRLISDLVIVMCSATLGGIVFALLNQPLITGYLLSGSLIGPGGFGLIVELVQVETLAQLGVVFLLFALGIEFSPSKLRHVQGVALMGGLVIKCLMERKEMTSLSGQIAVVVRVYHKFLGSYCITVVNYSSQLQLLTA
ncbi:unnamed protein product [Bathycoccus prasinos]